MKTLTIEDFTGFVLSNDEMLNVRGGTGDQQKPANTTPPTSSQDNPRRVNPEAPTRPPVRIEL